MRRAIILSCGPREELNLAPLVGVVTWKVPEPGKGVVQNCCEEEGSMVFSIAVLRSAPELMEGLATPAEAEACRLGYGRPRIFVRAWRRVPDTPWRLMAPEVDTEYWETMLPTSNVFAPDRVTERETGAPGWTELSRSAQRPPQPVRAGWSGTEVCH